jgi:uncharacterized membrane protein (DUF373 family)
MRRVFIEAESLIDSRVGHYISRFEYWVIRAVQVLMGVTILATLVMLVWLLVVEGLGRLASTGSVPELQPLVLRAFGGVMLVLLGLELMESLKTFAVVHQVRLEMILVVATIAASRHVILLDFEHASGLSLIGASALVIALTLGYALVRKTASKQDAEPTGNS